MKIGIFILSLWVSFFSFAQNTIGPQEKIIESLIFQKINTVRDSLGLNKLVNDEILVNAAILHSKYQGKIGKLTHYESKDKLRSPKNRVLHFGGTHRLVLENVASQDYDYAKGKVDNIADSFVTGWIKSPGHYKNLINPKGTLTGVGVVFDSKAKKYYATQVFGSLNEHIKANIENPENAFGIRNPEENYQKSINRRKLSE